MDYFDSVFVCIAIFCSILVFCILCCNNGKEDSEVPIHQTSVVVTSSNHTPLRQTTSAESQPLRTSVVVTSSNHTPLRQTTSAESQPLRSGELERPIGFTAEVYSSAPASGNVRSSPNPPYPVDNLMPVPESRARAPRMHPPSDDVNPPSYEQVMSNEAYYHQPPRN
uniref:Putative conserved secreted protein n=1 Tax=Lutzomyia longipalpis TaxID=7200 RepID=A0A1B0C9H7_LUTLO